VPDIVHEEHDVLYDRDRDADHSPGDAGS
jgi:hypothetical protein